MWQELSRQIVPAYFGHLWPMILKTDSNPEMDLYLLRLISLCSPCLSDRAKIYDSGVLCLTASLSHLGIEYLFSTFTFDHWIWLSEACKTMTQYYSCKYIALLMYSLLRGQSGHTKIKLHNTTHSMKLGIFCSSEIYQCILENLSCLSSQSWWNAGA